MPTELLAHLGADAECTLARSLGQERGSRHSGTWPELFGEGSNADEVFLAWAFASYVEHLAARGRAIADVPMYADAWLGPQPGQAEPGQYSSGGPASRVLDVWRAAAPYWDVELGGWTVAPGGYRIQVARDASIVLAEETVTLTGDVVVPVLSFDSTVVESMPRKQFLGFLGEAVPDVPRLLIGQASSHRFRT